VRGPGGTETHRQNKQRKQVDLKNRKPRKREQKSSKTYRGRHPRKVMHQNQSSSRKMQKPR